MSIENICDHITQIFYLIKCIDKDKRPAFIKNCIENIDFRLELFEDDILNLSYNDLFVHYKNIWYSLDFLIIGIKMKIDYMDHAISSPNKLIIASIIDDIILGHSNYRNLVDDVDKQKYVMGLIMKIYAGKCNPELILKILDKREKVINSNNGVVV